MNSDFEPIVEPSVTRAHESGVKDFGSGAERTGLDGELGNGDGVCGNGGGWIERLEGLESEV